MTDRRYWIATASHEHVAIGIREGIMQVNHGKRGPLGRTRPGDGIAYYSSSMTYPPTDKLQSFTAIGLIRDGEIYQGHMASGFTPYRRDVDWWEASPAPIRPLLDRLAFTRGHRSWGAPFRYGLFRVEEGDFAVITEAMGVSPARLSAA